MLTLSKDRQLAGCGKNIQAVQRFYKYKIDTNQNIWIKEYLDKLKLQKEQEEKEVLAKAEAEKKKAEEEKAKEQDALKKAQQAAAASKASASKTVSAVPVPAKTASVPALIDTLPLGSSSQAILILGSTASSQYTKCEVYEKEDAKWSKKWTFDSVVGRKGI
ncbi:MAG: hypothetical protein Q8930_14345, partial [Bacillota bacterium]|nr:hypothetical protein [Bacillota bacterium]